jgi:hypothetical protein
MLPSQFGVMGHLKRISDVGTIRTKPDCMVAAAMSP